MEDRLAKGCLSDRQTEDYLFGRLAEAELAEVEEHLLFCASCQEKVKQEEQFILEFREAADPAGSRRWISGWRWLAVSGLAASLVLMVWLSTSVGRRSGVEAEPVVVALNVTRSPVQEQSASAPRGRPIRLSLDLEQLPGHARYEVEIAEAGGRVVFTGSVAASGGVLSVEVPPLEGGAHWVRLQGGGVLLREYALRID